jgi:hypothetical protein
MIFSRNSAGHDSYHVAFWRFYLRAPFKPSHLHAQVLGGSNLGISREYRKTTHKPFKVGLSDFLLKRVAIQADQIVQLCVAILSRVTKNFLRPCVQALCPLISIGSRIQ